MTEQTARPIVLVPGYWLGAWAWDDVVAALRERGREVVALTLPGLDPDDPERAGVGLAEQVQAVLEALRAHPRAVLVGHSGAGPVVQLAADAEPDLVSRLVWVDSGPASPGPRQGPEAPGAEVPLPSPEALAEEGVEGLSEGQLATFRARAVPQPAATVHDEVVTTGAWAGLPATVVCCSIPSAAIAEMVEAGQPWVAALSHAEDLTYVDLPTGHWPMWSRPADLAEVLARL